MERVCLSSSLDPLNAYDEIERDNLTPLVALDSAFPQIS
jgi:hypothetical protein